MVQVLSFRPYLRTIATKVKEKLADVVVATSGGCNERSMWDLQSFEVLFKHNWDINECLGHIGDVLMFVFFFLILSCLETMLTYGDHSMAVDPANSHWSHIYLTMVLTPTLTAERSILYLERQPSPWSSEVVQLLLKHGAELRNRSALHKAASYGRLQICPLLCYS